VACCSFGWLHEKKNQNEMNKLLSTGFKYYFTNSTNSNLVNKIADKYKINLYLYLINTLIIFIFLLK